MARGTHPCVSCGAAVRTDVVRCAACHRARVRKRPEGMARTQRPCPTCGGPMGRGSRLCRSCRYAGTHPETGRRRAQRLLPELGQCEHCDQPAVERHHRDGDPLNNTTSNIEQVCRRCHMKLDGRLAALAARASRAGRLGGRPKSSGKPADEDRARSQSGPVAEAEARQSRLNRGRQDGARPTGEWR